ncbi:Ig-like domain-containing protein [Lactococcus petauri]|uniref:Ig-like domain-containing protein n=1 Tax=Lactococcus petauri TaxID=1940789 RepID=UPI00255031F2|nr:SpaA isopeptide-forming pilin-related protein [Lactococcus petauri]
MRKFNNWMSLLAIIFWVIATPVSAVTLKAVSVEPPTQSTAITEGSKNRENNHASDNINSEVSNQKSINSSENDGLKKVDTVIEKKTTSTLQSTEASPRASSVRKLISNVVDTVSLTDKDGNPLINVSQYTDIYLNIHFTLPNNEVVSGDQTMITLPSELKIEKSFSFNVTNELEDIIAVVQVDVNKGTVTLTYTDFVETQSNISGNISIVSKVNTDVVSEDTDYPIYIDVNGDQILGGKIHYESERDDEDELFSKYSWFINDEGNEIYNVLRVNPTGQQYTDVTLDDILKTEGLSYLPESFKIEEGHWDLDNKGIWKFTATSNVTNDFDINFKDNAFSIHLGNIGIKEYKVTYKTKVDYLPVNGENFSNYARMTDDEKVIKEVEVTRIYKTGSGEGAGSNYSIKIHKENKEGQSLAGAEFSIIRDRSGQTVGQVTTNSEGIAEVDNLLKDDYTVIETKAPEGYDLLSTPVKISSSDFGDTLSVLKTIINKKTIPQETSIQLNFEKELSGKELVANAYSFELKDDSGKVISTAKNKGNGQINFDKLTYDKVGKYHYTVNEVQGDEVGVTYDKHIIEVTVDVKDNSGVLVASATYNGNTVFHNSYSPVNSMPPDKVKTHNSPRIRGILPETGSSSVFTITISGIIIVIILSFILFWKYLRK